jgi:hypothetical protein
MKRIGVTIARFFQNCATDKLRVDRVGSKRGKQSITDVDSAPARRRKPSVRVVNAFDGGETGSEHPEKKLLDRFVPSDKLPYEALSF